MSRKASGSNALHSARLVCRPTREIEIPCQPDLIAILTLHNRNDRKFPNDANDKLERAYRLGFFGLDLGPLSVGSRLVQFPDGPLPTHNFVKFD